MTQTLILLVYSSYSACCYANEGCCYAKCDDDPSSNLNLTTYPPTGIPSPLGDWPCSYEISLFVQPGPPNGCNDPSQFGYVYDPNKPWCFMFDCTNALCSGSSTPHPTCCDPQDETCDCACLPPVNSMGAWNSLFPGYDRNDAVYWGDTDTDFCCFKCHCDYLGAPFTPGDPTTYDCNHFTPGDPPHMGVPNGVGEVVIKLQETHQYHSRGKEHYIIHVLLVLLILTLVIHVLQTDVKT